MTKHWPGWYTPEHASLQNATNIDDLLRQYRAAALDASRRWQFSDSSLRLQGPIPTLDAMYVPLRFTMSGQTTKYTVGPGLAVGLERRVVLSGQGGSGKTTALRWLFRRLLERADVLPIFITALSLRNDGAAHVSLSTAIEAELRTFSGSNDIYLAKLLHFGFERVVLLLDGWDEYGARGDALRLELVRMLAHTPSLCHRE